MSLIDGIGPVKAKSLIKHCGSAQNVFTEKQRFLRKIPEIGSHAISALNNKTAFVRAEKELIFIDQNNIKVHYYENENYPRRLLHCPDHPIVLYSKGKIDPNASKVLSIVGTRSATHYGKEVTQNIVEGLKNHNVLICSGLAFGIDAEAHKAAVKHNMQTIGTVAHGLHTIYPKEHSTLSIDMMNNGGVLSEFISGTIANKENFPRRNRIVAGMSDATLVIESKNRGGALITAYQASGYNRDVFAIPGKITDPNSAGCNLLIQKNVAGMVQSAEDIISAMQWEEIHKNGAPQMELLIELTEKETLLRNVIVEKSTIKRDEIAATTGMLPSEVATILLNLELKGVINALPGGVYSV